MNNKEAIVGIDLGTTNSEIAALIDGKVQIIEIDGKSMLPSCVGFTTKDELLIGEPAKNQQLLYPERTVRSIKRKMGTSNIVKLGNRSFSPPEISSLILRELATWASKKLGTQVKKAVITVPAYFSDAQRTATREAGILAGLDVVRILNEPTAASLAYGYIGDQPKTVMVYDLGGGTFDVSIVTIEGDITEVLSSHGDTHLGGDDFNARLLEYLLDVFKKKHGIDLREGHPVAYSRLWWAVEAAKQKLSYEQFVMIQEESLVTVEGKPLHLDIEISRTEYENLILPLIERTLESVAKALEDAHKKPGDMDAILLVGGSTRTPLVTTLLRDRTNITPRQEVHPDLCVALGAGALASRLAGHDIQRVLVDITPYTFGIEYVEHMFGFRDTHRFQPIIPRNTPLPTTRTESFNTLYPEQTTVDIRIFQGDNPSTLKNLFVGNFKVTGLTPNEDLSVVLCRMSLGLDGILQVTAIEKKTGLQKQIEINNALVPKTEQEIRENKETLQELYDQRLPEVFGEDDNATLADMIAHDVEESKEETIAETDAGQPRRPERTHKARKSDSEASILTPTQKKSTADLEEDPAWTEPSNKAFDLISRSRTLLSSMHPDDKTEAMELHDSIYQALSAHDLPKLEGAVKELKELLFFVEGK